MRSLQLRHDDLDSPARLSLAMAVLSAAVIVFASSQVQAQDFDLQAGDLLLGVSSEEGVLSIELARGALEEGAAEPEDGIWNVPFLQSLELDNLNGISHNPQGNLLALNFGTSGGGGSIWNLPTLAAGIDQSQMLGDTTGLTTSRLGGLSVSPDNSKIAMGGYDSGRVIVFDYTAGDSLGAGAAIDNGRETSTQVVPQTPGADTQGTAWLDASNVIAFNADGELYRIDGTSMEATIVASVDTGSGPEDNRSEYTDIEYNPTVSDYIYASYTGFDRDTSETLNKLYAFDPNSDFSLAAEVDFSNSLESFREIALGPDGTLYMGQFGSQVDILPGAADPTTIADDSSIDWYFPIDASSFSGLDVAVGLPIDVTNPTTGDFNEDGSLDAADINLLFDAIRSGANDATFDLNSDALVDAADRDSWVTTSKGTYYGDANLDGEFNSSDLVTVFAAGQYEDGVAANSTWETGDWNGDTEFDTSDLVTAFSAGGFEQGPRAAVAAVPEPSSLALLLVGLVAVVGKRRQTTC